jgi:hypothetical protein
MFKQVDTGSLFVILTTFVLFVLALFTKGFTHATTSSGNGCLPGIRQTDHHGLPEQREQPDDRQRLVGNQSLPDGKGEDL